MVEFRSDGVEVVLGERCQVGVLVQVLAQQSIGVLVGAALPRLVCCASFSMTMMASLGLATIRM